ncbi:MAG TPA: PQQ-dependent sugar dehydrogenase, partial [Verrucomicrobiae bacterium]|nr:PQQ-dependent sugar dehydrogenase [Verrucomicrobiae bacterium]
MAVSDSVTMHSGGKARIAVLANDTGLGTGQTIAVIQAPAFGSAVPVTGGRVLYSQTTGVPTSDSFTYRVTDSGGTSNTATVSIAFSSNLRIPTAAFSMPAAPPAQAVELVELLSGLNSPVAIASPPGDTQRVFVCQKGGLLRLVPNIATPSLAASPFLDLPTLLSTRGNGVPSKAESMSTTSEQGLLSVAFHPSYATNRQFYIFYSVKVGSTIYERVSMFLRSAADPNLADPNSEKVLIQQVDTADNHNGGDMHFGPDGYLYISFGDEGAQNDSKNNSQTITKNFFSAIARIDVDKKPGSLVLNPHAAIPTDPTDGGVARYAIPADNPYVGATSFIGTAVNPASVRTEFWAVGFRNPWRFSFDSLTGELWVGDVGQGTYEEINVVVKGGNYGWAFRE